MAEMAPREIAVPAQAAHFGESNSPFARIRAISVLIANTLDLKRRASLMRDREELEKLTLSKALETVERAFKLSTTHGWRAWLTMLAEALSEFRHEHSLRLCERSFPFEAGQREIVKEWRRAIACMLQGQWDESYEEWLFISSVEFLPARLRARLIAIRAQLELYRFSKPEDARSSLEEADALSPNHGYVLTTMGAYWLAERDSAKAIDCYKRALDTVPLEVNGYVGLGNERVEAESWDEAEDWFRQAISNEGHDGSGYGSLLRVLGRAETLPKREAELLALSETRIAFDRETEFETYLDLGDLYLESKRVNEARSWYDRAIKLQPTWPRGYVGVGLTYKAEGEKQYARAEEFFLRAIEVGPSFPGAYLEVTALYQEQQRWDDALKFYEKFPPRPTQWVGYARTKAARMCIELGKFDRAESILFDELRRRPGEQYAPSTIETLGGAYKKKGDLAAASRVYSQALTVLSGESREKNRTQLASLANARANIEYEDGNYAESVASYRIAIDLDPSEAMYFSNLAGGLLRLKEPGSRVQSLQEAIRSYEQAQKLLRRNDYAETLALLGRRLEFARASGEKALDLIPVVTPITIETGSDLIGFVEGTDGELTADLLMRIGATRAEIREQLGVVVPGLRFRGNEADLPNNSCIFMINEIPLVHARVEAFKKYCACDEETLTTLGVQGDEDYEPLSGTRIFWIGQEDWEKVEAHKIELLPPTQFIIQHVNALVRRNVCEFFGRQEIFGLLEESGDLFEELRNSAELMAALTSTCRGLLAEGVPVHPFHDLCRAFNEQHDKGKSPREIVEHIRGLPGFREHLPGNEVTRTILKAGKRFESAFRLSLYEEPDGSMLAMEPELCQAVLTAVRNEEGSSSQVLVVEQAELRPFIRKAVELEFPRLNVLSRAELSAGIDLANARVVEIDDEPEVPDRGFANPVGVVAPVAATAAKEPTRVTLQVQIARDFEVGPTDIEKMTMAEMISMLQDGLFYELGIIVPDVQLHVDKSVPTGSFRIRVNGVDQEMIAGLQSGEFLVNDTVDRLALLSVTGREAVNPANGSNCVIVQHTAETVRTCKDAGLTVWDARGFLMLSLSSAIRRNAARFATQKFVRHQLDSLAETFPALVQAALERFGVARIRAILAHLLEEEISVRDLRGVLEALLSINGTTDVDLGRFVVFPANTDRRCPVATRREVNDLSLDQLADFVRVALARYISHKYTRGTSTLVVYLLDPDIEKRIGDIQSNPLQPAERDRLLAAIRKEIADLPLTSQYPVILTTFTVRRALRSLIERDLPLLAVINYQELSPEMNIQPIARIGW